MNELLEALKLMLSPETFTEYWRMWSGIFSGSSVLLSIIGLVLVLVQLYAIYLQTKRSQRAETSRLFIEVMDRWSLQYENRNRLISAAPKTLEELSAIYPDASALLTSTHWCEEIRPLLNFYEFLGVLIDNQNIDRESIFVLVTVDTFGVRAAKVPDGQLTINDCVIYQRLKPYIDFLRTKTGYRGDIYDFYDRHLLREYLEHVNQKSKANKKRR